MVEEGEDEDRDDKGDEDGATSGHCHRAQELCESRGGRPGLPSLISLMVSVDVKHQ